MNRSPSQTQAQIVDRSSALPAAPGRSDPLAAAEKNLSRWLRLFVGLWCMAGAVSVLLHWTVKPETQSRGDAPFSDETQLIGDMAATHGTVLRAFEERTFDTQESLAELDRELAKHKKKLRELSLVSVQDPWSRDPLVRLRQRLIDSYYSIQDVLETMQLLAEGDRERQRLFESLNSHRGPLEEGRRLIVEATRELKIRSWEVRLEADTRERIYGLAKDAAPQAAWR